MRGPLSHAWWETLLTLFFSPKHQMITITESRAINPFYPGVQQSNHYCQLLCCIFTLISVVFSANCQLSKWKVSTFCTSCIIFQIEKVDWREKLLIWSLLRWSQGTTSQLSGSFLAKVIEVLWEHVAIFRPET